MDADEFNDREFHAGRLTPRHVTDLVARFQRAEGLPVDGLAGPVTRARLELLRGRVPAPPSPIAPATEPRGRLAALSVSETGWLVGAGVEVMPIHASRYYKRLSTADGRPRAIVAHYTATDHGTARAMARRMATSFAEGDRAASWHLSIEGDGAIVQQAPLTAGCWHAGGKTASPIPGIGPANRTSVGIELVGHGDAFPAAQVDAAMRVWRAIVRAYGVGRDHAMVTHQELDPTRKRDPGPLWLGTYAPGVLDYAYTGT